MAGGLVALGGSRTSSRTSSPVAASIMRMSRSWTKIKDPASIRRCVRELIKKPRLLTRIRYEQLAAVSAAANGIEDVVLHARGFTGYDEFADTSSDHLDGARVWTDLDTLEAATASMKAYTDKRIAHLDFRADLSAIPLTFR